MLNLLNYEGELEVDGKAYSNVSEALKAYAGSKEEVTIILRPQSKAKSEGKLDETVDKSEQVDSTEYRFRLPIWIAKRNSCPSELVGKIEKQTANAYYVDAIGMTEPTVRCRICGKELSNLNSRKIGIGPICLEKVYGFTYNPDDEDDIRRAEKRLKAIRFKMWLPKSQVIVEQVEE